MKRAILVCITLLLASCGNSEVWSRGEVGGVQAVAVGNIEYCKRRLPEGTKPSPESDIAFAAYCNGNRDK
jgi:hypothetical protein